MARSYAQLHTSIWRDRDFCSLPAHAQRLYLLAISQADVSYAGVVSFTEKRWAAMAGDTTRGDITDAANVLEDRGYVVLDPDTEELWVRSWCKYNGVLAQPNLRKAMVAAYDVILSTAIKGAFYEAQTDETKALLTTPPEGQAKGNRGPSEAKRPTDIVRDLDLDLDLHCSTTQGEARIPSWRDLLRVDAAPSLLDEVGQDVANLIAAHGSDNVDRAIGNLLSERRRYPWPSNLRKALEDQLGDAPERDTTARCEGCGGRFMLGSGLVHVIGCERAKESA